MSLLIVPDITRYIFSLALIEGVYNDCKTYRSIRLTSKRCRSILDTLSVRALLLTKRQSKWDKYYKKHRYGLYPGAKPKHWPTLASRIEIACILQAPKHVLRAYLLTEPAGRLNGIARGLFSSVTLRPDPKNKLFRHYVRHPDTVHVKKLYGCIIKYEPEHNSELLLEQLQFYLGFDTAIKQAYKNAVVTSFLPPTRETFLDPPSREIFALIGSLLPFTDEELTLRVDFERYGLAGYAEYEGYEYNDSEDAEELITLGEESEENDRLYLDEQAHIYRFHDPVEDERNTDPQYWSTATLRTWRERICYD